MKNQIPHPIRVENLLKKEKYMKSSMSFETICQRYFETLPDDKNFIAYRRSVMGKVSQNMIAANDMAYALWRKPRIYMIEEGIGELLMNTKLGDIVELEHFNLPFDSMYLDLPESEYMVSYGLPDGRQQVGTLDGVYILQDKVITSDDPRKYVTELFPSSHKDFRPITFVLVSKEIEGEMSIGVEMDDCLFSFPIFLHEGRLGSQIDEKVNAIIAKRCKIDQTTTGSALHNNVDNFRGIFGWLVNIILYITMPKSRVDRGKGGEGIPLHKLLPKKQRKSAPSNKVFVVGKGIKISHLTEKKRGPERGTGTRIKERAHWVSGHYRNVRYGPMIEDGHRIEKEKRKTRLRWVLPFPRGEGSEYFRNLFRVTE